MCHNIMQKVWWSLAFTHFRKAFFRSGASPEQMHVDETKNKTSNQYNANTANNLLPLASATRMKPFCPCAMCFSHQHVRVRSAQHVGTAPAHAAQEV